MFSINPEICNINLKLDSKKIFVTGASGFIGSAVVKELINAGYQVIGLARSEASAKAINDAGATVLKSSLEDFYAVKFKL